MEFTAVHVTGLPTATTSDDVMHFFTRVGNVESVHMPEANTNAPAVVVFDSAADAACAVSISGSDFKENIPIRITAAPPSAAPAAPAAAAVAAVATKTATTTAPPTAAPSTTAPSSTDPAVPVSETPVSQAGWPHVVGRALVASRRNMLRVTGFPLGTSVDALRATLEACGTIDNIQRSSRGITAYVSFTTEEAYEKALAMDGTAMGTGVLEIARDDSKSRRDTVKHVDTAPAATAIAPTALLRVAVRGLAAEATWADVAAVFDPDCGPLLDHAVLSKEGKAFFAVNSEAALKAAIAKSGTVLLGSALSVAFRPYPVCAACGKPGHREQFCRSTCSFCHSRQHNAQSCPRRGGGRRQDDRDGRVSRGGDGDRDGRKDRHRRRRSDSRDRHHRRHRSDSLDRHDRHDRRRSRHSRSRSRSRSPQRRRR